MSVDVSIEPITGWRLWGLSTNPPGAPVLLPVGAGLGEWPGRRRFKARCTGDGRFGRRPLADEQHLSPSFACTCGIYASASLHDLMSSTRALPALSVVGTVSMWGRTIEHERGWRSEYAYPARLTLVCAECVRSGSGEGRPAALALGLHGRSASGLVAVCSDHSGIVAEEESFSLFDPQEVQGLLLDRYAVDPLPFDAVRDLFERPRSSTPLAHRTTAAAASVRPIRVAIPPPRAPTPTRSPIAPTRQLGRPSIPRRVARRIGRVMSLTFSASLFIALCVWSLQSCVVTVPDSDAATSSPAMVVGSPEVTRPSADVAARRSPDRQVSEFPDFEFVCGIPHGGWVELVSCSRPARLFGFASSPPDTDCLRGDVAMTRRHNYSICWHSFAGRVDLVPHPAAADPFEDER